MPSAANWRSTVTLLRRPGQSLALVCASDLMPAPFCTTSIHPSEDSVT